MFTLSKYGPFYDADPAAGGGAGGNGDDHNAGGETQTLSDWIEALDEAQRETVSGLLDAHVGNLKKALSSERENRKGLEKQVREMAKAAKDGSDSQKQLTEFADKLEAAGRKSDFYEDAHAAGVSNLKLAYLAAEKDDLFDRNGRVDFAAMMEDYPELFTKSAKSPDGNAGSGTGKKLPAEKSMNNFIRAAAGR